MLFLPADLKYFKRLVTAAFLLVLMVLIRLSTSAVSVPTTIGRRLFSMHTVMLFFKKWFVVPIIGTTEDFAKFFTSSGVTISYFCLPMPSSVSPHQLDFK